MHLNTHVAAHVSESSQHVVDKFCAVSDLIVVKKVLHYQNKYFPHFQFQFVHWVFELWISDELLDLGTVKDASFQLLRVSILENPGTSKWSSHYPCPEPWWTAWLSRAWCAAVGRVLCLCPPEGRWWRSFLCKAPILPAKSSPPSCIPEHGPYPSHMHRKHGFMISNWFLFDIIDPELLDLNTSCHWNNHFQSKQ